MVEKLYEDNALGNLSDERYHKMMSRYETEQKELVRTVEESKKLLNSAEQKKIDLHSILKALREFTEVKELNAALVNKLIKRIEIHQNDKSSGHCHVKVDIYFTAVGMITIPYEKEIRRIVEEVKKSPRKYRLAG